MYIDQLNGGKILLLDAFVKSNISSEFQMGKSLYYFILLYGINLVFYFLILY